MARLNDLYDLYISTLQDLYSAENQMVVALPIFKEAAHAVELKTGLQLHFEAVKQQVGRLEEILAQLQESPRGKKCLGMEGLLRESEAILNKDAALEIIDAELTLVVQKMDLYGIATYSTAREYGLSLQDHFGSSLLQATLDEKAQVSSHFSELAERLIRGTNIPQKGKGTS